MAGRAINIQGQRFGRLLVKERIPNTKDGKARWLCICDCGKEVEAQAQHLRNGHTKSCGCLQREITRAKRYKGGRIILKNGYVRVLAPNHPKSRNGQVDEHRLVMEESLGRYLSPRELVHHKNGIRSDNRIENLELWTGGHPPGQRAEDIDRGVVEIKILRRQNPNIISSL